MSKEFNINDYQYVETLLTFNEWAEKYKPKQNSFNGEARFGGLLYEHEGDQWEHVVSQQNHYQWTLFEDENGILKIKNGLVVRGRIGYFLCEINHNSHQTFIVSDVTEEQAAAEVEETGLHAYRYRVIPEPALKLYRENNMEVTFDESKLNGELTIYAPDEETADSMRKTYVDIGMWEKI